jgi:hypothetical protein
MADLTSPNPLVMTHFELIAFVSAVAAVLLAIARDVWRARRRSGGR